MGLPSNKHGLFFQLIASTNATGTQRKAAVSHRWADACFAKISPNRELSFEPTHHTKRTRAIPAGSGLPGIGGGRVVVRTVDVSENRQDYYAGETPGVEESTQCQLTVLSSCNVFFESAVLQASITDNQHNESTVRKITQAANMNEVANSRNARVLVLIPSNTHIWPASTYCNFFASVLPLYTPYYYLLLPDSFDSRRDVHAAQHFTPRPSTETLRSRYGSSY